MSDVQREYVLTLTPRQAEFIHRLGRHLRKQESWWDDPEWAEEYATVMPMFQALPWDAASHHGRQLQSGDS